MPSLRNPCRSRPAAHRPDLAVGGVLAAVHAVVAAEAVRHEQFDGAAEQVLARVAEEGLGLGVDELDDAGVVDDDHGVRCGLQQPAEPLLGGSRNGGPGDGVCRAGRSRLLRFHDVAHAHPCPCVRRSGPSQCTPALAVATCRQLSFPGHNPFEERADLPGRAREAYAPPAPHDPAGTDLLTPGSPSSMLSCA